MLFNCFFRYLLMIYIFDLVIYYGIFLIEFSVLLNMFFFNVRNGMFFFCFIIDFENVGICLNILLNDGLGFFNY